MDNIEQKVPQVLINGIGSLNRIEKIISRHMNFSFEDLDQADELREAFGNARTDLFNYNQLVRKSKIQQLQQQQTQTAPDTPDKPNPEMSAVKVSETSDQDAQSDE